MLMLRSPADPEDNFFAGLHDSIQREIFNYLDFDDLVNVSHTCMNFRNQIKSVVRLRTMSALAPFFGSFTEETMNLLQFGGGCVSGHVITAVFNLRLSVCDFPKDLQVFVPQRGRRVLLAFIREELRLGPPQIVALDDSTRQLSFGAYRWSIPVSHLQIVYER